MDVYTLLAIAERCEQSEGPCRELDATIAAVVRSGTDHKWAFNFPKWEGRSDGRVYLEEGGPSFSAPLYTNSIDAPFLLIDNDEYWRVGNDGDGADPSSFKATVTSHDDEADIRFHDAHAATAPLALCAAALRAIAKVQP